MSRAAALAALVLGAYAVAFVVGARHAECPSDVGQASAATPPSEVLARWNDGDVRSEQLSGEIGDALQELDRRYALDRYNLIYRTIDGMAERELLERARVQGGYTTVDALLEAEVDRKIPEPSDDELKARFEQLRQSMPGTSWQQAREPVRANLLRERVEERRATYIQEMKAKAAFMVDVPYPDLPRADVPVHPHDPVLGNPDAPVTVVQFGEFQCYYCQRIAPVIQRLHEAHPNDVRIVFKDFPLSGHERARAAAVAAHCAGAQGRYWEMWNILLERPDRYADEDLRSIASDLHLDVMAWDACVHDVGWQERIEADLRDGRRLGIDGTPTFFVNGMMVAAGMASYGQLEALVQRELAARGQARP